LLAERIKNPNEKRGSIQRKKKKKTLDMYQLTWTEDGVGGWEKKKKNGI
jgi:hypothetical protein